MTAFSELVLLFGHVPVMTKSPSEHRVYAPSPWHLHDGAAHGTPFADGKTLEEAYARLLEGVQKPGTMLVEGECDQKCFNRYNRSPARKIADRELIKSIKQAAEEVRGWPAWKRGLPPCAEQECEREYGHEGKHRKTVQEKEEW